MGDAIITYTRECERIYSATRVLIGWETSKEMGGISMAWWGPEIPPKSCKWVYFVEKGWYLRIDSIVMH